MKLSDCVVGDVVSFCYRGGTHGPHEKREVKVTQVYKTGGANKGITGEDLVYGGVKRFADYKAINVALVVKEPVVTKRMRFDKMQDLVKELVDKMSPEELMEAYSAHNPDFVSGQYNSSQAEFVIDEKGKASHKVYETTEGLQLSVANKHGDEVTVYIDKNNTLHTYSGGGSVQPVDIVEFVEFLKRHLDE